MKHILRSLTSPDRWRRRLLVVVPLATFAMIIGSSLLIVNAERLPAINSAITHEEAAALSARVKSLEEWRDETKGEHLDNRITIIETTLHIQETNRTLLWSVLGVSVLSFFSSLALVFISKRVSSPKANAAH